MRSPVYGVSLPRFHCHLPAGLVLCVGAEPRRRKIPASFKRPIFRSCFPVTSRRWAQHFWPEEHSLKTTARQTKTCSSLIKRSRRRRFQTSLLSASGSCFACAHLKLNGERSSVWLLIS